MLVREGLVSDAQVKESLESGKDTGYGVSESLVALGYVTESQIVEFLAREFGVPAMDIDGSEADEAIIKLVPGETALEKFLVPVRLEGAELTVAVSDPSNILLLDDLGFITGKNIKPVVASERSIREKLAKYYGASGAAVSRPDEEASEEASVDSVLPGGPDTDLHSSSGISAPVEDIMNEPGRHESELSSSPDSASGGEPHPGQAVSSGEGGEDKSQPVHASEDGGTEQANQDEYVFDLSEKNNPHPGQPLSGKADGEDSPETEGEGAGRADLPGEEDHPGQSAETPSGGHAVQEEERPETPHAENLNPPGPGNMTAGAGRTVLIVDVSPTVRKIMTMTLERAGYRVSAACDGMQALARINETIPDLVFVDIRLPHMDGYQLCKVLKSHGLTKTVPVILVSGKTGVLDKMKVRMAGASDLITKPFSAGVLVETAGKHAG